MWMKVLNHFMGNTVVDMTWRCAGCCSGALRDWTSRRFHYIQRNMHEIKRSVHCCECRWSISAVFCLDTLFSALIQHQGISFNLFQAPSNLWLLKACPTLRAQGWWLLLQAAWVDGREPLEGRQTTGCISEAIWHDEMRSQKITAAIKHRRVWWKESHKLSSAALTSLIWAWRWAILFRCTLLVLLLKRRCLIKTESPTW